jgi:hypothetical protein
MRTCLACQTKLSGRIDKKYCDHNCRNAYHNELNRCSKKYIHLVNKNLSKNYKILEELTKHEVFEVKGSVLKAMGFDYQYFTSMVNDPDEGVLLFIYDLCYQQFDQDIVIKIRELETYRNSA